MKNEEVMQAVMRFASMLKDLPHVKSQIEPEIPFELILLQDEIGSFIRKPSAYSLERINRIGRRWEEIEAQYAENIRQAGQRLDGVELPEQDKEILRTGYAALHRYVQDFGKKIKKCRKVYSASDFAEANAKEFDSHMTEKAGEVHERLMHEEEMQGGVIFYSDGTFEIDFREDKIKGSLDERFRKIRGGDRSEALALYTLAEKLIAAEMEKASAYLAPERMRVWLPVIEDLEQLKRGEVTEKFQSYLRRLFGVTYAHDFEGVLNDDSLFAEGSPRRLFAFFHHNPDSRHIFYPDNQREPTPLDGRVSLEIGPQVVFVPQRKQLDVYAVSRGIDWVVGKYPV